MLPVRNAGDTLDAALRSVARQRETRFECVLVDDGSTDDSPRTMERFAGRDPRFRILRAEGRGLVAALQQGLAACRAPLVARMDADDVMHRDRLAAQLQLLDQSPELAGVGCHVRLFPRGALSDGMRAYESWLNQIGDPAAVRREAFIECPLAHPTLTLRREALCAFGYRDMGWPEDYDLVLRMLTSGHALGVVPRRLHLWRDGPGRLSRSDPAYATERFSACKAEFLAAGPLRDHPKYVLWGYGDTGRTLRSALAEQGRLPARIVELHPGRLGNRIHGAPVVPPDALRSGPRLPIVVSVAGATPRRQIRDALADMGFQETRDFVCAA